ncbi:DUF1294 domain-containing protein [Erythrobacter sp. Alg231-14]|uniref:DUF1294 domain-containing protein n=1 Tax=Erythrobacter sp. Alg231-14 TaxID=1922225 RepID=UPI000D54B496
MNTIRLLTDPAIALVFLCAINYAAFAAFGIDKAFAENGKRRVSEATLLQLAFFGGIIGAYAGRALFRHKTRKKPFSKHLHMIAMIQLCACLAALVYFW